MYPLGHIGIAAFVATLFFLPALYAVLGGILPDVLDKVFFTLGILPCGRSFFHSLFFGPLAAAIVFALTRNKKYAVAIWFGAYSHLILDAANFVPWFYPVVSYAFNCGPVVFQPPLLEIAVEIFGLALIVTLIFFKWKVVALRYRLWKWYNASTRRTKTKIRKKKR